MIPKNIKEIQKSDIEFLIQNSVAEGKTIEYKENLPGNNDSDKKEFLADVSSFANANGGDLIYGLKEDRGLPVTIKELAIGNIDSEISRLENIIRDGIDPRMQYHISPVNLGDDRFILLIRIQQSWIKPHRVILGGHDKFYSRNSNGKYSLDVSELRQVFNLSESAARKIQNFRVERISELSNNNAPVPFYENSGKTILHLIPLESFVTRVNLDTSQLEKLRDDTENFRPMYGSSWSYAINLEGIITYNGGGDKIASYTQIYRNGIIETVEGMLIDCKDKSIPSYTLEEMLLKHLKHCVNLLTKLNINPPVFVFLTLTGVKDHKMEYTSTYQQDGKTFWRHYNDNPIRKDILHLPEVVLENFDEEPNKILKPVFDLVWNACGISGSLNFSKNGDWIRA